MGVSGSGKSTIGASLARALGVDFVEGDQYHTSENVRRMAAGVPLTDDDRAEWLRALAERIRQAKETRHGLVLSCSSLKRSYRDVLRTGSNELRFVFLRGDRTVISQRLTGRSGHFMPPSLLESQVNTLEEPSSDEEAWVCDIRQSPEEIVAALVVCASA
jgi:gluconokinase